MKRTMIGNLEQMIDQQVMICGWLHSVRKQKNMIFAVVRDYTGLVQLSYFRGENNQNIEMILENLTVESAIIVTGELVANESVRLGSIEIKPKTIEVVSSANSPLPLSENSPLDTRLDWRFLDLRRDKQQLIMRVQTVAEHAMRLFWQQESFVEMHSPKLMGTASESGSELFRLPYFGGEAFLAQSPQFFKQMAMAAGLERVFEVGPVFRANKSHTVRHDTEFTSVDVEFSWIDSHHDVMEFEERWLQFVLTYIKNELGDQITEHFGIEVIVPELPFPRVTMAEAQNIVAKRGHVCERKDDLDPEGERQLGSYIMEQYNHQMVFVTDYPIDIRPFYHMRSATNPNITNSFDLLWNGLEVTTGAQREHRYDFLCEQAIEKGLALEPIQFYLDFFRYGMPSHGGYGFGLTRMLMVLLGLSNVREVTYVYRGVNRLTP
jgi:aspartyl-tRNA synthetase